MPTTTAQGVWFPDDTAPVAPLEGLFSQQATSIDIALTSVQLAGWASVPTQAARDALFPSPVAGNKVWRTTLRYGEVYYDTTGSTSAGWYPAPGSDVGLFVSRASTDSWSATTRTNINGITGTLPAGRYLVQAVTYLSGPASTGNAYIAVNGADITAPPCDQGTAGTRDGHMIQREFNHSGGAATVTVDQLFTAAGSKTIYAGSTIEVRYLGPRK